MKPIVNLEEHIGKTVGRRQLPQDSLAHGMGLQATLAELSQSLNLPPIPKGAFKFSSFEEADAWMMKFRALRKTT